MLFVSIPGQRNTNLLYINTFRITLVIGLQKYGFSLELAKDFLLFLETARAGLRYVADNSFLEISLFGSTRKRNYVANVYHTGNKKQQTFEAQAES